MKDSYLQAKLIEPSHIRIGTISSLPYERFYATLIVDHKEEIPLTNIRIKSLAVGSIVDFSLPSPLALGHSYFLKTPYGLLPLDVSEATSFEGFDRTYYYEADDLGMKADENGASFLLYAPLASSVLLSIRKKDEKEPTLYKMKREDTGVWRLLLKGDYLEARYTYRVTNNEVTVETTDPYAKASTQNGEESVVFDFSAFPNDFSPEALPILHSKTDAIIYEGSVRDLTVDSHTDIVHKGRFLGLIEKGRKTQGGNPAGFDYFSKLGFTHLQLLPIYDFKTVDETAPLKKYNWGYDPAQYFVPEGSYASDLSDPFSRIRDLKALVKTYHQAGIRIVMDVVYNHVYEYQTSVFEKVVPNFYFRKRANGQMANTSGCGDDLASERPMVRKMILDACKWWIDYYGIDGFRFDLMGILDVKTIQEIQKMATSKKKDFMIYGEGWNMGGEVPLPLAHMGNFQMLPEVSFFNDFFRESGKRLFAGDLGAKEDFKAAFLGSCHEYGYHKARFLSASQSINYLECHDNMTYYDYLRYQRGITDEKELLLRSKMGVAGVLFSFGIPFIHAGEEIAQSKFGADNTYNKGDEYNKFSYRLLDERKSMALYFEECIRLRKSRRFLHLYSPEAIAEVLSIDDLGGGILFTLHGENVLGQYKEVQLFLNPTLDPLIRALKQTETILFMEGETLPEGLKADSILVPKCSWLMSGLENPSSK